MGHGVLENTFGATWQRPQRMTGGEVEGRGHGIEVRLVVKAWCVVKGATAMTQNREQEAAWGGDGNSAQENGATRSREILSPDGPIRLIDGSRAAANGAVAGQPVRWMEADCFSEGDRALA